VVRDTLLFCYSRDSSSVWWSQVLLLHHSNTAQAHPSVQQDGRWRQQERGLETETCVWSGGKAVNLAVVRKRSQAMC